MEKRPLDIWCVGLNSTGPSGRWNLLLKFSGGLFVMENNVHKIYLKL